MCIRSFSIVLSILVIASNRSIYTKALPVDTASASATVTKYVNTRTENGYTLRYETSDKQTRHEVGKYKTDPDGNVYLEVQGFYSYVSPDGQITSASYIADKDGFRLHKSSPGRLADILPEPEIAEDVILSLIG